MSAYLLILAIEAVVLLAVWRRDERARRAELQRRRHLRLAQAGQVQGDLKTPPAVPPPGAGPAVAAPGAG